MRNGKPQSLFHSATTPVRVVSSTFGQAVVSFEDGVPPEQVDVEPEASLSCG